MSDIHEHDCDPESEEEQHRSRMILAHWELERRKRLTLWERIMEWCKERKP